MPRTVTLWILAVLITLASAYYQRRSGPTYPARGTVALAGQEIPMRLTRTHGGPGDQPVRVRAADPEIGGEIAWRRYPTRDAYAPISMERDGEWLVGYLPHQPPAGKLEYQVRLHKGAESILFPPRPAVTRFKGDVPAAVLIPHVLAMFLAMLFSNRAGLEALTGGRARRLAWTTMAFLVVGGFVLGPIIQKMAFGDWWTGVPFGIDLTDNKTLIAGVAWAAALWFARGGRPARTAIVIAALVMIGVFAIPHSMWGSEIRWEEIPQSGP